jgi:hypothetical protein
MIKPNRIKQVVVGTSTVIVSLVGFVLLFYFLQPYLQFKVIVRIQATSDRFAGDAQQRLPAFRG